MPGWDKSFSALIADLEKAFERELPGMPAQFRMVPAGRGKPDLEEIERQNPKRAGVLALFYPVEDKPHVVLMKRNTYPGVHSGQISFPGGRVEDEDANLVATALREAEEEVGVPRQAVNVLGEISKVYIPPSDFLVQPVIGYADQRPMFVPEDEEVDELLEVPIAAFCDPKNLRSTKVDVRGFTMHVPAYHIDQHIVWGATAMMMSEITHMLSS